MVLLPLLFFVLLQMLRAMENSELYRNPTGDFTVGNFAQNPFHFLWEKKITSSKVADQFDSHCECAAESCSVIKLCNPKATSGPYVIDPDGEGGVTPFTVDCDMSDKENVGVTVISHDSEDRTEVKGCDPKGCYKRDITYTGANLLQLGNLTAISAHCKQFIKYECHSSVLLYNGNMYGWWVSREEEKMTYWGGSNSGFPYKCACGVTGTCAGYGCNCDRDDATLRQDSGLLTDKSRLPVIKLRFGDLHYDFEYGYYTLGKLKCYGHVSK